MQHGTMIRKTPLFMENRLGEIAPEPTDVEPRPLDINKIRREAYPEV